MITNAQKINYKYLSLSPPDCVAAEATALFAYMHMQPACSVRVGGVYAHAAHCAQ